jgi:hypothetical protein
VRAEPEPSHRLAWIGPRDVLPQSATARRLIELGLAQPADLLVGADAAEMLEHAGRVERVAAEVEVGEVRLDRIAARLAALAGDALADATFVQVTLGAWESVERLERSGERPNVPEDEDDGGDAGRISDLPDEADPEGDGPIVAIARLRAQLGADVPGSEVLAIDRGPFVDLPVVLGLLNALLRDAGSERRLVVLRGAGPEAKVVAGPRAAIEAAIEEGLLALEGPDDALMRSFDGAEVETIEPS